MLELHEILLKAEDKLKLKKLCEIKSNMIRYKDALTLIQVNKDLNSDGSPSRSHQGFWILQIPMRKDNSRKAI